MASLQHRLDGVDQRARRARSARPSGSRSSRPAAWATGARGAAPRTHRCCRARPRPSGRDSAALRLVFLPRHAAASIAASNALPSGSGPTSLHQRMVGELGARHQQHQAEAARIVEGDARAGRHVKHDMVVRAVLGARMMEFARRPFVVLLGDPERARHAEMHHQHVAGGKVGEQIFRPPPEPGDGAALEPLDEILRQRPAQVGPARLDLDEPRALHHRLQAAADGLDFGQFGHARRPLTMGMSFFVAWAGAWLPSAVVGPRAGTRFVAPRRRPRYGRADRKTP